MTESVATVEGKGLAEGAAMVASIVRSKPVIPIAGNVRLSCGGGKLSLLTASLGLWASAELPLVDDCEPWSTTVAAQAFRKFANDAPKGAQVELSLDGVQLVMRAGSAELRLATLPPEDFPVEPEPSGLELRDVDGAAFARALKGCAVAMAREEARYYLVGVHFGPKGLTATDAHRLHHFDLPGFEGSSILGAPAAKLVADMLSDGGRFGITSDAWQAETAGRRLTGSCIEGTFPDWERIIPIKDADPVAVFYRDAALEALARVDFHEGADSRVEISGDGDGSLLFGMQRSDGGAAACSCDAVRADEFKCVFNPRYLKETWAVMPTTIAMFQQDAGSPALFEPAEGSTFLGCRGVVMPQRA
ncbi:MAG: DNA polymerase III subunit beta [Pseudomonadota bacterium]